MENLEVFESGIVPAYELIKINYETEPPTISARELHKKMEVKYDFARWVNSNFKEFVENVDFSGGHIDVRGNQYGGTQIIEDYNLSVDMAKHLCLMSKTEKGKICRQYLIDLEKAWNTPEQIMARALKMADKTIDKLKMDKAILLEAVKRMKPKEIFADAVSVSNTSILIGELAKILKQNGIVIGQNRLFVWMRNNNYLIRRKGTDYNMPTQKSMELGLFEIKERTIANPDGSVRITKTVLVTGKGQQYFVNKFLDVAQRENIEL